jgi:hypothetical protein
MSTILRPERAVNVFGVEARAFAVIAWPNDPQVLERARGRIAGQTIKATRYYTEGKHNYRITVELRFDDECKNGHESFAITADIRRAEGGYWREESGGCLHDDIAKRFPEWAHLIPWHLTSTDGPMHYIANTVYQAGDRDYNGLRKGESRQLRNGRTKELCWELRAVNPDGTDAPTYSLPKYADGDKPADAPRLEWRPWLQIGEGKARELDHARSAAVWPEATDAELMQEPEQLRAALQARLPDLLARFKADMLAVGFMWPEAL